MPSPKRVVRASVRVGRAMGLTHGEALELTAFCAQSAAIDIGRKTGAHAPWLLEIIAETRARQARFRLARKD